MDQQQIRSMMRLAAAKQKISKSNLKSTAGKQQSVVDNEVRLSGKEKVQLLKLLKDKNKTEGTKNIPNQGDKHKDHLGSNQINVAFLAKQVDPKNALETNINVQISDSFFDTGMHSTQSTMITKTASSVTNVSTSIPSGFFDDPIQDLTARGLSMKQQLARQDEIEKKELNSLIAEIGEINEDTAAIDAELESEFNERDFDEAAIQMAYITMLAKLYKQSDSVVSSSRAEVESNENFESALHAADTESKVLLNSNTDSSSSSSSDPLQVLVDQKLSEQQFKRRRVVYDLVGQHSSQTLEDQQESDGSEDEDDDGSYDPLAFI